MHGDTTVTQTNLSVLNDPHQLQRVSQQTKSIRAILSQRHTSEVTERTVYKEGGGQKYELAWLHGCHLLIFLCPPRCFVFACLLVSQQPTRSLLPIFWSDPPPKQHVTMDKSSQLKLRAFGNIATVSPRTYAHQPLACSSARGLVNLNVPQAVPSRRAKVNAALLPLRLRIPAIESTTEALGGTSSVFRVTSASSLPNSAAR